jgi:hypothetical protein
MKNITLLLLAILVAGIQLYSQKMIPGYILTEKGDSLPGEISGQDVKNFRDSFLFVPTMGG